MKKRILGVLSFFVLCGAFMFMSIGTTQADDSARHKKRRACPKDKVGVKCRGNAADCENTNCVDINEL